MCMDLIKISIIIPIYNAQQYLDHTIESVLNQTFTSFELILVNDGSTDESERICKKWKKQDDRIKYIYQSNSGVTAARAKGLSVASGVWVMFCDSDDLLPNNSFELLMMNSEYDYDIIIGNIKNFSDENSIEKDIRDENLITVFDNICFIKQLLNSTGLLFSSPCAKLYKHCLFNKDILSIPKSIVRGEDFIMNFRYAMYACRVCYINNYVYYYRQHAQSAIHIFHTTWEYEKNFLKILLSTIQNEPVFNMLKPDIMRCVIRSLGNAYQDKSLNRNHSDYVAIRQSVKGMHLGVMEYIILDLIVFPASIRYFLYRVCRKILFYTHKFQIERK